MSIGNLKDSGNQGNNFPYQKAVLKGLALAQCRKLTESQVNQTTAAALVTSIQGVLTANPDKYLVNKTIVWNGTNFTAFLTLASL